ncbi:TPA: phage tail protein, partial [Escherichia coli]
MTVTPAASPALSGQKYAILVSDIISVDGLAQAMSQLIKEYDENIGAWETFATTSANQNITVTINGTSLSIPALGKLLQKGSNGALPVNQGGTGATNAADALTNLGLGEAAKRNVGTGANQIPDMSLFASSNTATAAAQKFPSGLILQCGQLNDSPNVSSTYGMRFPMTFSRVLAVTVTLNVTGASGQPTVSATNVHNTGFDITVSPGSGYG